MTYAASKSLGPSRDQGLKFGAQSPTILSVFPTFAIGGSQSRFVALANSLSHDFRQLMFAVDGRYDCFDRLPPDARIDRRHFDFPRGRTAANVVAAYKALRRVNPALLVTYNWGAIEWALAATFTNIPYVHIVDGFGPEEAEHQLARRVWFRRLALARCQRVIVPSHTLHRVAREVWHLPANKITHIPNGVDVDRFARRPNNDLISMLGIPRDRRIVGTVAALRPEKNIPRLLRAIALVAKRIPVALVIVGEGDQRPALESQVLEMGLGDAVIFAGTIDDPTQILGIFDVFAISSDTEQMPISVLEAMSAGLPIAGVDVGDVKAMVSDENRPFIVDRRSTALAEAILDLLLDERRPRIGAANHEQARMNYSLDRMVRSYTELFLSFSAQR